MNKAQIQEFMIQSQGGQEALQERWAKEQEKRDQALRDFQLEEFIHERNRRERRNLIRDLFGI